MANLNEFYIHTISEPRPYPVSFLRDNALYPILINGIVNPNGPTLTVVAAVRDQTSAPLALVYAYLNPFRSEVFISGYLLDGQLAAPFPDQILKALKPFSVFSSGVPTLCIPAGYLDAFDVRYLYSRLFANYGAIRNVLERLKRFPLNPWDRVSEEMQAAMESLIGDRIDHPDKAEEPLNDEEMNALLDIILDTEHNKIELRAFTYAWEGSIDQQRESNNSELADNAFQFDDFVPLLGHLLGSSGYELK